MRCESVSFAELFVAIVVSSSVSVVYVTPELLNAAIVIAEIRPTNVRAVIGRLVALQSEMVVL
jgi:hypothetical protein